MSPLSITVARHLHHNACIRRSVPLSSIDGATTCFSKAERDDDDYTKQTQSITAPNHSVVNSSAITTTVRYYSCHYPRISPLHYHSSSIAQTSFLLNKRKFHTTSRTEILPFIAVGVLGATTIYTYRALEQMDKEWDEYYEKVEEYKAKTGIDPEKKEESCTVSKQKD